MTHTDGPNIQELGYTMESQDKPFHGLGIVLGTKNKDLLEKDLLKGVKYFFL